MRVYLLFALLSACTLSGFSQITISSANYNTVSLNETNCMQLLVSNSSTAIGAIAQVSCKNSLGEVLFEATSKNFTLSSGVNQVNGATIGFTRFNYGTNGQALYLKNNGLLASGNYSYCVKIIPQGNVEGGDIYCEEFEAANSDFLNLVSPYDKETLDTKLPLLTWTHSEPFNTLAANEYFKIVVTEIKKDQSPEQAVFSNPVVFSKNFVNSHSVPYPQDAKELEDGKKYAWQVQKISNNIIVNKTDVWQFSLDKKVIEEPLKYVLLMRGNKSGLYRCVDEVLYFRFDETYETGGNLNYALFDDSNKKIEINIATDNEESSNELIKAPGVNKYELNVQKYRLKEGYYRLDVFNEKGETYSLKFQVIK